jgi:hypothetical protein
MSHMKEYSRERPKMLQDMNELKKLLKDTSMSLEQVKSTAIPAKNVEILQEKVHELTDNLSHQTLGIVIQFF